MRWIKLRNNYFIVNLYKIKYIFILITVYFSESIAMSSRKYDIMDIQHVKNVFDNVYCRMNNNRLRSKNSNRSNIKNKKNSNNKLNKNNRLKNRNKLKNRNMLINRDNSIYNNNNRNINNT